MSRFVSCVALVLATTAGKAQTELKWKWRAGETFYVQTTTKVKQTLVIEDPHGDTIKASWNLRGATCVAALAAGQPLPVSTTLVPRRSDRDRELRQSYEHTTLIRYTIQKHNADGSAVLTQQIERDRNSIKGTETSKQDPTLEGAELTLHVDARGQVTKVEGGKELLKQLTRNDTAREKALAEMLAPETLRASATQTLGLFPAALVKKGDGWNVTTDLALGSVGRVKISRDFTLDSVEDRGATKLGKVSFRTIVSDYRPAKRGSDAYQIKDGYLTEASGKGNLEVDLDAGRPLSGESRVKLAGYLILGNSTIGYRVRLDQEQTVTTRVTSKLPPKEEPKK
jgi:hypothetical protein